MALGDFCEHCALSPLSETTETFHTPENPPHCGPFGAYYLMDENQRTEWWAVQSAANAALRPETQ